MAVITVLLTVGICLSGGCENLSNAERIETMKESSTPWSNGRRNPLIVQAFPWRKESKDLSFNRSFFSFAKENELYSEESLSALESSILNDSSYFDSSASFFSARNLDPFGQIRIPGGGRSLVFRNRIVLFWNCNAIEKQTHKQRRIFQRLRWLWGRGFNFAEKGFRIDGVERFFFLIHSFASVFRNFCIERCLHCFI